MKGEPEDVAESIIQIGEFADENQVQVAQDFIGEIQNYLLMERVRDLTESQKAVVVLRIGEEAIADRADLSEPNVAIRDDVRTVILRLCEDQFGRCYGAARKILEDIDDPGDLSPLLG